MTKEEVVLKVIPHNFWEDNLDNVPLHCIHTAMEEYGRQEAIRFFDWVLKEKKISADYYGIVSFKYTNDTIESLYAEYQNEINNPSK